MSSEKQNKAAAVRKFQTENPNATVKEIAAAVGCDVTYVYLVRSADRRKNKTKKTKPTRGQEVVRQVLNEDTERMYKMAKEQAVLHAEISRLNTIIDYLERKVRGASV